MRPIKLNLKKLRGRGQFRMDEIASACRRTSAKWEIQQLPGLILKQTETQNSSTQLVWYFSNIHLPYDECSDLGVLLEDLEDHFHNGVLAWNRLQKQEFLTRQEALQALEAVMLLEEDAG